MGGEANKAVAKIFTNSPKAADKYMGKPGEIVIDFCNSRICVYDGCNCGPCFCLTVAVPLCDQLTELPVSDTPIKIEQIDICAYLQSTLVSDQVLEINPSVDFCALMQSIPETGSPLKVVPGSSLCDKLASIPKSDKPL